MAAERPHQNSAGQVTSKPLFRNSGAILMKRLLFLALPSSPPSCSRLAPCSFWACVCERVVGPDCPPEGSEFPPGLGLGLPPFLSVFLLSFSGWRLAPPGQGTTPKHAHARIMENVKELFWCDARDEQGHLQHAPDCEQRDCFVVQGKQQEKNTGAKAKLPDYYRCTITCAFCGKRKHYEDEC